MVSPNQINDIFISKRLRDRFVAGDDSAYSEIYELYAKDLYAFGLSLRVKPEIIEDAIHDIFVDIYTRRQNLEKVDNLKYYFIAAFRNRLFFLLKKEPNTLEMDDNNSYSLEQVDYQEIWIEKEERVEKEQLIRKLYSELNKNQQEAIYHRYVEGLSCDEIAKLMNINYQSAKNLIHRAIKKMKTVAVFTIIFFMLIKITLNSIN